MAGLFSLPRPRARTGPRAHTGRGRRTSLRKQNRSPGEGAATLRSSSSVSQMRFLNLAGAWPSDPLSHLSMGEGRGEGV